ncbi:MAG: response regulator transcription factor [Eubacteriales bacterium]|nr:response regulator transcription factor [Eubacteriales bacterium]
MASILAIDDEPAILEMIKSILSKDGHLVTGLTEPRALNFKTVNSYDLILLDIMMPGVDGLTLCRTLRSMVDCPIVFLTAKSGENSVVNGLALGADDYICKPFGVMELRARIAAHLRREKREHFARLSFESGSFNLSAKELTVRNQPVPLTKGEYEICEFLARNQGQVFSREQIFERVFGFDSDSSDSTIATHIKNIRTKLQELQYAPIKTVWGVGYKWEE